MKQIPGIQATNNCTKKTLSLSQKCYIQEIGVRFGQTDAKLVSTPLSLSVHLSKDDCSKTPAKIANIKDVLYGELIGQLLCFVVATCPDIAFAVRALSKFLFNPGHVHWQEVLRALHYALKTQDLKLTYDWNHKDVDIHRS